MDFTVRSFNLGSHAQTLVTRAIPVDFEILSTWSEWNDCVIYGFGESTTLINRSFYLAGVGETVPNAISYVGAFENMNEDVWHLIEVENP